jgi:hypothetical protein
MNRQLRRMRSGATALVLAAGLVVTGGGVARAAEPLPYTDGRAVGFLGLCDRDGNTVTGGSIHDKPFVWRAVTSVPAAAPYDAPGGTATLLGFQPREHIGPGQWSGELLTASARYSNTKYPMAQATDRDFTLADFLGDYPATWDGYVQLRVYLGAPDQPPQSITYSATDIKVTGDTWKVVRGGAVPCTKGDAVSLEAVLPASNTAGLVKGLASPSPTTGSKGPAASASSSAVPSVASDPEVPATAQLAAGSTTTPSTTSSSGRTVGWLVLVLALAGLITVLGIRRRRAPVALEPSPPQSELAHTPAPARTHDLEEPAP